MSGRQNLSKKMGSYYKLPPMQPKVCLLHPHVIHAHHNYRTIILQYIFYLKHPKIISYPMIKYESRNNLK